MSQKNQILALIVIVLAILSYCAYFFMQESLLSVKMYPPSCDPSKVDCSKFTPDGTPFVREPQPANPTSTTQVGQIDEHLFIDNALKDVNFCGKTYRVKQVKINGVDVMQRVADLVTKNLLPKTFKMGPYAPPAGEWTIVSNKNGEVAKAICENISLNNPFKLNTQNLATINEILEARVFPHTNPEQGEQITYLVTAPGFHVVVNSSTNEIFTSSDYDGSVIGPLGKLKQVNSATTTNPSQITAAGKDAIDSNVDKWKTYTDSRYGFHFMFPNYFGDLYKTQPKSNQAGIFVTKAAQGGYEIKYKGSIEALSTWAADIQNMVGLLQVNIYDLNSYRISDVSGGIELSYDANKEQWWQDNGQVRATSTLVKVKIGKSNLAGYKILIGDAGEGFEYNLIPLIDKKVMLEVAIYRGMGGIQNLPIDKILSTFRE